MALVASGAFFLAATANVRGQLLYQTGFENFPPGTSLGRGVSDGFVFSGSVSAQATVTSDPALVLSGLRGVEFSDTSAPASASTSSVYRPTQVLNTLGTTVTASADLAIKNASDGNATRGAISGFGVFDLDGAQIANMQIVWDHSSSLAGGPADTYYYQYSWYQSPADSAPQRISYPINGQTAEQLDGIGFTNFSIDVDYKLHKIKFGLDGTPEENLRDFAGFNGFGYAAFYYRLEAIGGVAPRLAADNYTISKTVAGIPGDYNDDGYVDAADYTVWADNFGAQGSAVHSDGNLDGVVNAADYTTWADHFGQGTPPGGPAGAVPEPAALCLLGLPTLTLTRRTGRARRT